MARQWREAGAWLSDRAERRAGRSSSRRRASASTTGAAPSTSRSVRCPGRTTRCAMPCRSPPRARSGSSTPSSSGSRPAATWRGAVDVLRRLGVRYLVLRNDLDTASAGQPSVTYARSAIRSTPGVALARGSGPPGSTRAVSGSSRSRSTTSGSAAPLAVTQPVSDTVAVSGGPEDLLAVADAGVDGLAVLDGDRVPGVDPGRRVVTDGYRGARAVVRRDPRARHVLDPDRATSSQGTRDYRPWDDLARHAVTAFDGGVAGVSASSSLATDLHAGRPASGRPPGRRRSTVTRRRRWVTQFDPHPVARGRASTAARSVSDAPGSRCSRDRDRSSRPRGADPARPCAPTPARCASTCPRSGAGRGAAARGASRARWPSRCSTPTTGDPAGVLTGPRRRRPRRHRGAGDGGRPRPTAPDRRGRHRSSPAGFPARTGASSPRTTSSASARAAATRGRAGARPVGSRPRGGSRTRRAGRWTSRGGRRPTGSGGAGRVGHGEQQPDARRSAGRPEALVDGDERTAWSPAPDDASPDAHPHPRRAGRHRCRRCCHARRGWMARHRPFVRGPPRRPGAGRAGIGRRAPRVSADGTCGRSRSGVLPLAGRQSRRAGVPRGRGAPRSPGTTCPSRERVSRPCGAGPSLDRRRHRVPTRLDGPRSALWGEGDLTWRACAALWCSAPAPPTRSWCGATRRCARPPCAADPRAPGRRSTTPRRPSTSWRRPHAPHRHGRRGTAAAARTDHEPQRRLGGDPRRGDADPDRRRRLPSGLRRPGRGVRGPRGACSPRTGPTGGPSASGSLLALLVPLSPARARPVRAARQRLGSGRPARRRRGGRAAVTLGGALRRRRALGGARRGRCARRSSASRRRRPHRDAGRRVTVVVARHRRRACLRRSPTRHAHPSWVEAAVTLAVIAAAVLAGAAPVVPPSAWRAARRRRGSATPGPG